jgi:sugar phosphate isomerase/epimerase
MDAALARIGKAAKLAERKRVKVLLENLNPEPDQAEVHYLCADLEECKYYFDRLDSPALGWSFTVNHAHIRPNRVDEFMQKLDLQRCGEVRLADCRGTHEEHLRPGEGTLDFRAMFAALEKRGYRGHYMQAYGSLDDMLKGRETLARLAEEGLRK